MAFLSSVEDWGSTRGHRPHIDSKALSEVGKARVGKVPRTPALQRLARQQTTAPHETPLQDQPAHNTQCSAHIAPADMM